MLSDAGRRHLSNLVAIAMADSTFAAKEFSLLCHVAERYGISSPELHQLITAPRTQAPERPRDIVEIVDQLFELAQMVLADDVVEDAENTLLRAFARNFGVRAEMIDPLVDRLLAEARAGTDKPTLLATIRNATAGRAPAAAPAGEAHGQ